MANNKIMRKVIIDTDPGIDDAMALMMALQAHDRGKQRRVLWYRITYQTISKLTFFMKILHFSILNNILQHEITEKQCWTELFFI